MLKTAVIGVGNAGGNVAKLVHEKASFPAIALNTSNQDLTAIGDSIPVLLFGDGKGIGKNRDGSKEELKKSVQALIGDEKMINTLKGAELIFVVSSCGGGTGSGTAIILATIVGISYPNATVIPIGIAPQLTEGFGSQLNFVDYYAELKKKSDTMSYMIYDNNQYSNLPHKQMIETVNDQICRHIQVLSGVFNNQTDLDSIDDRDMLTIVSAPGRLVVVDAIDIKERDVDSSEGIEKMLIDNLKNSAITEPQKDGRVTSSGIIADISEKLPFNPMIPTVQDYIGVPIDSFQHISINKEKALKNDVYLIMSGLSMIRDRKDRASEIIKERNKKQAEIEAEDDDDDDLSEFRSFKSKRVLAKKKDKPAEATTFDDIFKSFGM